MDVYFMFFLVSFEFKRLFNKSRFSFFVLNYLLIFSVLHYNLPHFLSSITIAKLCLPYVVAYTLAELPYTGHTQVRTKRQGWCARRTIFDAKRLRCACTDLSSCIGNNFII